MGAGGLLQSLGTWFASSHNKYLAGAAVVATTGGLFGWNYFGGDPSQLKGIEAERFDAINQKQQEELATGGETTAWKRLSCGLFRRSSMQAIIGAVSGGIGAIAWALGSGYMGPGHEQVKTASMVVMVVMSGIFAWSVSQNARKLLMGLAEDGTPI
jgi:hypothetical protein